MNTFGLPNWQEAEQHYYDIRKALKQTGCSDNQDRIRRMRPEFWQLIGEKGHSHIGFNVCDCNRGRRQP